MKQKIGICIFGAVLVLISACAIRIIGDKNIPEDELKPTEVVIENQTTESTTETEATTEKSIQVNKEINCYEFKLGFKNDKLVVFTKENEVYLETGIDKENLPLEIQKRIKIGYTFKDETDLYSFLESYSS